MRLFISTTSLIASTPPLHHHNLRIRSLYTYRKQLQARPASKQTALQIARLTDQLHGELIALARAKRESGATELSGLDPEIVRLVDRVAALLPAVVEIVPGSESLKALDNRPWREDPFYVEERAAKLAAYLLGRDDAPSPDGDAADDDGEDDDGDEAPAEANDTLCELPAVAV